MSRDDSNIRFEIPKAEKYPEVLTALHQYFIQRKIHFFLDFKNSFLKLFFCFRWTWFISSWRISRWTSKRHWSKICQIFARWRFCHSSRWWSHRRSDGIMHWKPWTWLSKTNFSRPQIPNEWETCNDQCRLQWFNPFFGFLSSSSGMSPIFGSLCCWSAWEVSKTWNCFKTGRKIYRSKRFNKVMT